MSHRKRIPPGKKVVEHGGISGVVRVDMGWRGKWPQYVSKTVDWVRHNLPRTTMLRALWLDRISTHDVKYCRTCRLHVSIVERQYQYNGSFF